MNNTTTWLSLPPSRRHHRSTSIASEASTIPDVRSEADDETASILSTETGHVAHNHSVANLASPSSTSSAGSETQLVPEFDDSFYNTFEGLSTRHPADLLSSVMVSPIVHMDLDGGRLDRTRLLSPDTDTSSSLPSPTMMDSVMMDPPFLVSNTEDRMKQQSLPTKLMDALLANHQTFVSGKFVNVQPMSHRHEIIQLQQLQQQQLYQQQLLEQYRKQVQALQHESQAPSPQPTSINLPQADPPVPHEYNTRHKQLHVPDKMPENPEDDAAEDMVDDAATIIGEESEPSDSDRDDVSGEEDELDSSDSEYVEGNYTGMIGGNVKSPHRGHQRSASNVSNTSKSVVSTNNNSKPATSVIPHTAPISTMTPTVVNVRAVKSPEKPARRRKGMYTPIRTETGEKRFLCPKCETTFKRSHGELCLDLDCVGCVVCRCVG